MDRETAATPSQRMLTRAGHERQARHQVSVARTMGNEGVTLGLEPAAGGERETLAADNVLVAIGRRPFTEGLGLDEIGVARDRAGRVEVDEAFRDECPRHLCDR